MKYNIREVLYQDQDEMICVRKILLSLKQNYPNFDQWLDKKVMTQLGKHSKNNSCFVRTSYCWSNGFKKYGLRTKNLYVMGSKRVSKK